MTEEYVVSNNALTQPDPVSLATVTIWTYLIPQLYVEYAEHALALEQQTYVSSSSSSSSSLLSFKTINMAKQNLKRAFAWNTLIGILIYWGSSLCIALFTIHLDRRMTMIVIGSSRIFAAVVFCILSFQIPQWFGMYYKAQRRHKIRVVLKESSYSSNSNSRHNNNHNDNHNNNDDERGGSTVSPRAFRFQFSWSLWKQLSTMFFFSLFFSCFTKKFSTLYGILVGIPLGVLLFYMTYLARNVYTHHKRALAIGSIMILMVGSCLCMEIGLDYIQHVWQPNRQRFGTFRVTVCWLWPLGNIVAHLVSYRVAKTKRDNHAQSRFTSAVFQKRPIFSSINHGSSSEEDLTASATTTHYKKTDGDPATGVTDDVVTEVSFLALWQIHLYDSFPYLFYWFKPDTSYESLQDQQTITLWHRIISFIGRFLWYASSGLFLFLAVVNIGATAQQQVVREALGSAWDVLYPQNYQSGPLCAWDENYDNIRTFDTLEAVYDANFSVVHCGECAACSNWNDLRLQWTTRDSLAAVSRKCAQKSIFGTLEAVHRCNQETIGFTPECAKCWTYDEINTKNHCFFIFLQSIFIDAVLDFQVGFDDITSATCDEAISGPEFVPCSGATRRRMNIVSDIERPEWQQCNVVKEVWSEVFNHP